MTDFPLAEYKPKPIIPPELRKKRGRPPKPKPILEPKVEFIETRGRPKGIHTKHHFVRHYAKNPASGAVTPNLIRMVITEMNKTLSPRQVAWFHNLSVWRVKALARKLRAEGFHIPLGEKGVHYSRTWKLIEQFKKDHPKFLGKKAKVNAIIKVHSDTYYLDEEETERLVKLIPVISGEKPIKYKSAEIYGKAKIVPDTYGQKAQEA